MNVVKIKSAHSTRWIDTDNIVLLRYQLENGKQSKWHIQYCDDSKCKKYKKKYLCNFYDHFLADQYDVSIDALCVNKKDICKSCLRILELNNASIDKTEANISNRISLPPLAPIPVVKISLAITTTEGGISMEGKIKNTTAELIIEMINKEVLNLPTKITEMTENELRESLGLKDYHTNQVMSTQTQCLSGSVSYNPKRPNISG